MRGRPLPARAVILALAGSLLAAGQGHAQAAGVLDASHAARVRGESGNTLTMAVRLENRSGDSLTMVPHVVLPAGWTPLIGSAPIILAPHEGDSWLISVRIPAHARAGTYAVPLEGRDRTGAALLRDSIAVVIGEKRGVATTLAGHPSYAVSGEPYRIGVLVQNRGNVDARFFLTGTSSLAGAVSLPRYITLAPDASLTVHATVRTTISGHESLEDIVSIAAVDSADTAVVARTTSRVTMVQRANAREPLHTLAASLRLRAADASTGVSPFELLAGGLLRDGGAEHVDVVLRSRVSGGYSLGDQEEYRVGVQGAHYQAQLGDAVFNTSALTSTGQRGAGAGLDVGDTTFGASAYAQSFRFQPTLGIERGGTVRAGLPGRFLTPLFGVSAVSRSGGLDAGTITSGSARVHPMDGMALDVELAASRAAAGPGAARTLRFRGGTTVRVDAGHRAADALFAGYARGSVSDYAGINTEPWKKLQLTAAANRYRRTASEQGGAPHVMQQSAVVEVHYDGRYSLGYVDQARTASFLFRSPIATNRGLLARGDQSIGLAHLFGSAEVGRTNEGAGPRTYDQLSAGVTAPFGAHTLSIYGQGSQGAALLRGAERVLTVGMDLQAQLPWETALALSASRNRAMLPNNAFTQVDARLAHRLASGATVAMRMRVGGFDFDGTTSSQRQAYLEYSLPLQLPVGPSHTAGRAHGRVVEQGTGRGLSGALVRLGPQAAITDADGEVTFAGLPAGEYRLMLAQQPVSGTTVFNGNPNVRIEASNRAPADFHVAVEAGGTIDGTVRRLLVARTAIEAGTDSLADGGPLESVTIELSGARDTLYRTTNAAGGFEFTDVPSGTWTVRVVGEPVEQTEWLPGQLTVTIESGERKSLPFRLTPRRRKLRIISGDGVIQG